VLERYVGCLLGKYHRVKTSEELSLENGEDIFAATFEERGEVFVSSVEERGSVTMKEEGLKTGEGEEEDIDLSMEVTSEEFPYNSLEGTKWHSG